jgi:phosphatidylglycerol:prolipoprotein diacylglycerol transferase
VSTTFLLIPWFRLDPWVITSWLKIQPFGILVAIGIVFGTRIAEWRSEKVGIDPRLISDFLVYTIGIGLLSAMVLNVVFYDQEKIPEMGRSISSLFRDGPWEPFPYPGLSSFGGFLGGVGAAFLFRARKGVSIAVMGDLFCFAFPFAWLFGRTGCFTVHDHPGLPSHFFLAVDNYDGMGVARHDLGLYEVLWSLVAIGLNLWLGKRKLPRGFFMAFIPLLYAPVRFFLDYLREIPAHGGDVRYFGFTPGQYGSLLMFVVGLMVAVRVARGPEPSVYVDGREAPVPPPEAESEPEPARTPKKKHAKRRA